MTAVKITSVGESVGVVLPEEVLHRLRVSEGDILLLVEVPNGVQLTPCDPEVAEQMAAAERVMREDRDVLRRLAE